MLDPSVAEITIDELTAFLEEIGAPRFDARTGLALTIAQRLAAAVRPCAPGFTPVDVQDGDTVVFHCDEVLSDAVRRNIVESGHRVFGRGVRVCVLDRGLAFAGVLRRSRMADADQELLDEIAGDLFADLCQGDGEHSEPLDRALIRKHLQRAVRPAAAAASAKAAALREEAEQLLAGVTSGEWTAVGGDTIVYAKRPSGAVDEVADCSRSADAAFVVAAPRLVRSLFEVLP